MDWSWIRDRCEPDRLLTWSILGACAARAVVEDDAAPEEPDEGRWPCPVRTSPDVLRGRCLHPGSPERCFRVLRMINDMHVLAGSALIGLGVIAAIIVGPSYELLGAGLVGIGFALAVRALIIRERMLEQTDPATAGTRRRAEVAVVAISVACGWLASGGNEVAWFGTAMISGILIWWCTPGMMNSSHG